jgi:hypothetical protein
MVRSGKKNVRSATINRLVVVQSSTGGLASVVVEVITASASGFTTENRVPGFLHWFVAPPPA